MDKKKRILGVATAAILILSVLAVILLNKDDTETTQNKVITPTLGAATVAPTSVPVEEPTKEPTKAPTEVPTETPTATLTATPEVTEEPTPTATPQPTATATPTLKPTATPTPEPTKAPTATPTPKPTSTPKPTATPKPTEVPAEKLTETLGKVNVGEYVTFGRYEQDNDTANGAEEIEWLVLDKQDGKMLLLSKYGLDCKPFNEKKVAVTWETCTLRSWLNNEFYNTAFNNTEQDCILETHVVTEDAKWGRNPVNDTDDNIFILSIQEVTTYFDPDAYVEEDTARITQPTAYAEANGADAYDWEKYPEWIGNARWWLRTPGYSIGTTAYIDFAGWFDENGTTVNRNNFVSVRPALWVSIE